MRRNKGITLIALVITIIVLLILAAVSIATLTGENGILTQAQKAKEKTKNAEVEEQRKLAIGEAATNLEDTKYIDSKSKKEVTIPAGMAPTRIEGESTLDEGLVVIDKRGNEWVWIEVPKTKMPENLTFENETGYSLADEEECEKITTELKTYANPYTKGSAKDTYNWKDEWYLDTGTGDIHNIVTEKTASEEEKKLDTGCGLTLNEYKETYQKMLKSVYTNGGFWIGRYEAGIEGSTGTDATSLGRTSHIDIKSDSPKAISQKDAIPYNFVTYSEAQKLASQMTPDETRTSSLMFGIQWDLVCKFIEEKEVAKQGAGNKDTIIASINSDSGSWGNYSNQSIKIDSENAKQYATTSNQWNTIEKGEISTGSEGILLSTGASNKTKKLNIYDLAGNEWEDTLDHAYDSTAPDRPCGARGGRFRID